MSANPVVLRLVGDYLIPGEGEGHLVAGGAVDIDATGRIVEVGAEQDLTSAPDAIERVGGLLMPGLVNGHAHGPMTLVRSVGDGLPLHQWLTEAMWPIEGQMTADDVTVAMELALCEMLLAGVTTSVEMYMHEAAVAAAAESIGARCQIMAGVLSVTVPDADALAARLADIGALRDRHSSPDSAITVGYGAHSVYDLGPDRLRQIAAHVEGTDAIVHIHLEETSAEREEVLAAHGRSATEVLADTGVLDAGHVVTAHGVWLSDSDMALLAANGAAVIHCPQSNLKLGSGVARVRAMLDAGITVGIGTDGAASNDDLNLWDELRLTPMLARGTAHDPTAMGAPEAFALATNAGAAAIGMPDVGALRAGAWADVVRIDLDQPALQPLVESELFAQVVWAANAHHVSDVWVGGRPVVKDGMLADAIDYPGISARVNAAAQRLRG